MKVAITGGAGFIGSHLAAYYLDRGAEVAVLDDFRTGSRENLRRLDVRLIEGSVLDGAAVRRALAGAQYVFHLAALVSVPQSMEQPAETVRINVLGLLEVLAASREAGAAKLCLASSAAVYGESPADPKREDLTPDPRSPYAITKLDGEYYCDLYRREGWLSTVAVRFFNVFGPGQDPRGPYAAAVPIFIERALRGAPLQIHGDGRQTRDFIYVKDLVACLAFLAEHPEAGGVYNAGYGNGRSILQLAETVKLLCCSSSGISHGETRPGDVRHSRADVGRLRRLGWQPRHGFDAGLGETIGCRVAGAGQPVGGEA
jgi:UDP-glucose 4-epimerase